MLESVGMLCFHGAFSSNSISYENVSVDLYQKGICISVFMKELHGEVSKKVKKK